jgi:glycosyltransferase involved in cell wall biosynthesis
LKCQLPTKGCTLHENAIPIIRPVMGTSVRPIWSVLIPVYNCFAFLPQTLKSVLAQDSGEAQMEIIVVDDCSTDGDVEGLVNQIGKGRIRYVRQPQNVGSLKNFETCLNLSRGHLIHLLHGDDYIKQGYYQKMTALFTAFPEAGAACCNIIYVDDQDNFICCEPIEQSNEGILDNWLQKLSRRQHLQYCAVSVRRKVYEEVGGFYGVHYGEDWEMWTRIAARYPFVYTPLPLATYRRHDYSISGHHLSSGQHVQDIKWVIDTIQQYIPAEQRETSKQLAYKSYARQTMAKAFSIWYKTKNRQAALTKIKEAFSLYRDSYLIWRALLLHIWMGFKRW